MAVNDNSWILLVVCILVLGLVLLGVTEISREGFQSGMSGVRCGVDLPTCTFGLQCMNGFCEKTSKPTLPSNQLSVYP